MSTADVPSKQDWAGRYYHVDQVMNAGGPRTDSQFAAGDEVGDLWTTQCQEFVIHTQPNR